MVIPRPASCCAASWMLTLKAQLQVVEPECKNESLRLTYLNLFDVIDVPNGI